MRRDRTREASRDIAASPIAAQMSLDLTRMVDALAIGLAIEIDPTVVENIRAAAGRHEQPLIMKLPNATAGIEIQPSGRLRPVRMHDAANGEDMDPLLPADLMRQVQLLTVKSRDHAAELLAPIITPGAYPRDPNFSLSSDGRLLSKGFQTRSVPACSRAWTNCGNQREWRLTMTSIQAKPCSGTTMQAISWHISRS
ncbi:protein of unknown function [Bradyrhizobium vignae]|uniref:Uncharacterized protein n=1 Tax=Bradyrhizobium vignae TaxID=1549949 RepID=A0A2U3PUV7_9BRAD|nr:protein of unknown function [Bradyrhizobium vignae]